MYFHRHRHFYRNAIFFILSKNNFWYRVIRAESACVGKTGEGDPGNNREVNQIVAIVLRIELAIIFEKIGQLTGCALVKNRKTSCVLEITKSECIVIFQYCRSGVDELVDENSIAAQPIAKFRNCIRRVDRKIK